MQLESLEKTMTGGCPVLKEKACRYLNLFNHAPVAIAIIDPQTKLYVDVNQVLCDRLKYSREELLGSTVPAINPRFQPAALSELARRVRTHNVVQFYSCQTTSKGEQREVLVTVTPIHREGTMLLHCTTVDITVPLRDERRLIDSEKRFRETFEQAAVGIAHVAVDGTFLRVNQRYCEIVGYPEAELRSIQFQDITHPEDLAADWERAQALLRGEIVTYSLEKRYIQKDQTDVWVNLTVSLARNEIAEPEYFIAVVEDIRGRKQAEAERDDLIRTLEEQVRRRTEELERLSMTDALTGIANRRCFDKMLAAEWARYNIQVNCIAPGFIVTDLNRQVWQSQTMLDWLKGCQANPNPGTPEDVAPLAVFLAGRGADYITGQVIAVDGGYTTTAMWPLEPK